MRPSLYSSSGSDSSAQSSEGAIESAREKVRQAEDALKNYLHGGNYNQEKHAQLVNAVKVARDEFVNKLAELWPEE